MAESDIVGKQWGESSEAVRERTARAREMQLARQGKTNAMLGVQETEQYCRPDADGESLVRSALTRLGLSARAYHRVLRIGRTIADLAANPQVSAQHLAEAIQYRRFA